MKRLSILLMLLAFVGLTAFAQQPYQRNIPSIQNAKFQALKHKLSENRTQIDTFANILPCDSFIWTPTISFSGKADSGFFCGHNTSLDSSKAEQYSGVPGDQINGLWMWFGYARATSSTQVIHVRVWDATGANGSPGNVIGTKDITVQSIATDVNNFDLTTVNFDTPIPMPAGGNFYAGFTMDYKKKQGIMTYDSTRAVAIFSMYPANSATGIINSCSDDSTENTAWEQWSSAFGFGGGWHSFWDAYSGIWAERNIIWPIVETTTGCTAAISPNTSTICKGTTVALTASGGTTYTWSPSTGLDVTTGATVNAKPSVNTTYTVTANNGACSATATITVNKKPVAKFTQGTCSGGHVLLTRTGTPTSGVTFKWFKNGVGISGATNSTYSATTTGNYKVKVVITATGCAKTSPEQLVTINCKTTTESEMTAFTADAYPNPFTKSLSVNISSPSRDVATVQIMDFSGRTLNTFKDVDVTVPFEINEDLTPGVYFIKVVQGSNEKMIKVVKSE